MTQVIEKTKFSSLDEFREFVEDNFINGSCIDPQLFKAAVEFHSDIEATPGNDAFAPIHEALNWNYTRFGQQAKEPMYAALLKNEDGSVWQAIVGIWDEERQRPYKYLAPTENGDRAFLPPIPPSIRKKIATKYGVEIPTKGSFWQWVKDHGAKIPRITTEGGKKGLALLSQGYLGISLYGCRCGNAKTEGEPAAPAVTDDLADFCQTASIWLIAFDRDTKEKAKRAVSSGIKNLSHSLHVTAHCWVEAVLWEPHQGKGVDDLIKNNGSGAFDNAYSRALSRLEKQFTSNPDTSSNGSQERNPSSAAMAAKIAEDYRELLKYRNDTHQWMLYAADKDGQWTAESEEYIESMVYRIILAEGISSFSSNYVTGIVRLLRSELIERKWNERPPNEILPFSNGVLEVATQQFTDHAPGYRLTWQLPREYIREANSAPNINAFLDHLAGGNQDLKDILLCFANAVLKGRSDLQKYLHLIGLAGTGKGTFSRLMMSLVGKENCYATSLDDWCGNQF
ncbi:MAG: DUF3854 domain-containing protein [Nostoc sp. ChiSLP01]|nr:DUF3854 domain-containing protein [Nostoc sp. CmiSLP01]MDZ8287351.1 DUF3854 domain-containing protein [Nostoc sp. ChiSLP01]